MSAPLLDVRGIDVFYGDVQVLWDLSFTVGQGEVVALIGANGAGSPRRSRRSPASSSRGGARSSIVGSL